MRSDPYPMCVIIMAEGMGYGLHSTYKEIVYKF